MTFFCKCIVGDQDKTAILRQKSCRESARKKWVLNTADIHSELCIYVSSFLWAWSFVFAVIDARKTNLLFYVF